MSSRVQSACDVNVRLVSLAPSKKMGPVDIGLEAQAVVFQVGAATISTPERAFQLIGSWVVRAAVIYHRLSMKLGSAGAEVSKRGVAHQGASIVPPGLLFGLRDLERTLAEAEGNRDAKQRELDELEKELKEAEEQRIAGETGLILGFRRKVIESFGMSVLTALGIPSADLPVVALGQLTVKSDEMRALLQLFGWYEFNPPDRVTPPLGLWSNWSSFQAYLQVHTVRRLFHVPSNVVARESPSGSVQIALERLTWLKELLAALQSLSKLEANEVEYQLDGQSKQVDISKIKEQAAALSKKVPGWIDMLTAGLCSQNRLGQRVRLVVLSKEQSLTRVALISMGSPLRPYLGGVLADQLAALQSRFGELQASLGGVIEKLKECLKSGTQAFEPYQLERRTGLFNGWGKDKLTTNQRGGVPVETAQVCEMVGEALEKMHRLVFRPYPAGSEIQPTVWETIIRGLDTDPERALAQLANVVSFCRTMGDHWECGEDFPPDLDTMISRVIPDVATRECGWGSAAKLREYEVTLTKWLAATASKRAELEGWTAVNDLVGLLRDWVSDDGIRWGIRTHQSQMSSVYRTCEAELTTLQYELESRLSLWRNGSIAQRVASLEESQRCVIQAVEEGAAQIKDAVERQRALTLDPSTAADSVELLMQSVGGDETHHRDLIHNLGQSLIRVTRSDGGGTVRDWFAQLSACGERLFIPPSFEELS